LEISIVLHCTFEKVTGPITIGSIIIREGNLPRSKARLVSLREFNIIRIYRVIQEDRSIIWEVIASVIVGKKVHMNTYLIQNGYRNRAV
jgi:hypothetical protein